MSNLTYHVAAPITPLVTRTVEILQRQLLERAGIRLVPGDQRAEVVLDIQKGIGREGFRIEGAGAQTRITGNDERGLLYGVGKFLRDRSWRGTSVPEKQVRGMYFATHFHNFYHDAPIAEVNRYIEDLALWGCNTLLVWFDMHHYTGIADPAAQAMIVRLRSILRTAASVGMRPGLTLLANEAYATSSRELRADWTAGHDGYFAAPEGHYHVEICPNQPGGLELILRWREEMLDAFRDVNLGFIVIWPYDQGGCTCSRCAPWGANGFLKVAEPLARRLRQRYPAAKLVLSTWYFDHFTKGEWAGLSRAFANKPDWVDYLLADDYDGFPEYPLQHGMPGGLPGLNFPEISMNGIYPWGGFGANPRPAHWQAYWTRVGSRLAGGFPYSEGIFEDLNKVITLQFCWNSQRALLDTVREYVASEFSPTAVDELTAAVQLMETGHKHSRVRDARTHAQQPSPGRLYQLDHTDHAAECAALVRQAEKKLTGPARSAWRWRIFAIRAALDEELARTNGAPSALTEQLFTELTGIYYADQAEDAVSVPSLAALRRPLK